MKAHGIHQSSQPIRETTIASRPSKRTDSASGPRSKKRKLNQFNDSNTDTGDDDEGLQKIKPESVKAEKVEAKIKEEPAATEATPFASFAGPSKSGDEIGESSFFSDFVHPSVFDPPVSSEPPTFDGAFDLDGFHGLGQVTGTVAGNGDAVHDSILITD